MAKSQFPYLGIDEASAFRFGRFQAKLKLPGGLHKGNPSLRKDNAIFDLSLWLGSVDDTSTLIVIAVAFLAGGLVKGLVGGGLPSIVVPVMAIVVDPAFAAAVTLVPVAATNVWQALDGRLLRVVLRRFWIFYVALFIGVAVGSQILVGLPPQTAAFVIGVAVVLLSPIPLATHYFYISPRKESICNPLMGGLLGLLGGATVIFTPVLVYFAALRLDKNLYVAGAAVTAICSMVPLYLGLGFSDTLNWEAVRFSVVLLAPTMAGYLVGRSLRGAISQRTFRLVLTASLVSVGIGLVYKGMG